MAKGYRLQDCEAIHREFPRTFSIPRGEVRRALEPGWLVKLVFGLAEPIDGCSAEKMWVEVLRREARGYAGRLTNQPRLLEGLDRGDEVYFDAAHIAGIEKHRDPKKIGAVLGVGIDVLRHGAWPTWIAKIEPTATQDSGWRVFSKREATHGATVRGVSTSTLFRAFAVTDSAIEGDSRGVFRWDEPACEYVPADALPPRLHAAASAGLGADFKPLPDLELFAVVTKRVLEEAPATVQRTTPPKRRLEDSGWSMTIGDETQDYIDDTSNSTIARLDHLLGMYPYLERVLGQPSKGMWTWDADQLDWTRI